MVSWRAGAIFLAMAIAALQTILDRIDSWPPGRQERAAELLASLEARDSDDVQVSDADLAEINRRIADADIPGLSLKEFDARMDRLLGR